MRHRNAQWTWIGILLLAVAGLWAWQQPFTPSSHALSSRQPGVIAPVTGRAFPREANPALPAPAYDTLRRIAAGGPYPHRQDGRAFENRERHLPARAPNYYREYTVETPGARDRGARRIVTGGKPPREYWYTDDRYRSFRRIESLHEQ